MSRVMILFSAISLLMVAVFCQNDCSNPPPNVSNVTFEECCNLPQWKEDEPPEACKKMANPICLIDCIFNETKILQNGEMDLEYMRKYFSEELKDDPIFIPIVVKAFETCLPMAKKKLAGTSILVNGCNPFASIVTLCVNGQIFLNCPATKLKPGKMCEPARDFVGKCLALAN